MATTYGQEPWQIIKRCAESIEHARGEGHARYWASRPGKYSCRDKMAVLGYVFAYRNAPEGYLTYQALADTTGIDTDTAKAMIREWWEYHTRPVGVQDARALIDWVAGLDD